MLSTVRTLYSLAIHPIRGSTHRERLESFYTSQASDYDSFREHLLHGRRELIHHCSQLCGRYERWIDLGCGTASNLSVEAKFSASFKEVLLVDLCDPLLAQAKKRSAELGLNNTRFLCADVCNQPLPEADLVTFSYSLTMIPNWFAALENALAALRPGGILAVTDFYVSRKYTEFGHKRHPWFTRGLWPLWFGFDNVFLSPDHLPWLESHTEVLLRLERRGRVPFLPLVRAPYYLYVGKKR